MREVFDGTDGILYVGFSRGRRSMEVQVVLWVVYYRDGYEDSFFFYLREL